MLLMQLLMQKHVMCSDDAGFIPQHSIPDPKGTCTSHRCVNCLAGNLTNEERC